MTDEQDKNPSNMERKIELQQSLEGLMQATPETEEEVTHMEVSMAMAPSSSYRPWMEEEDEEAASSSLWLITFTDAMALMLTFFVMLYAMSAPSQESWDEITKGTKRYFGKYESPEWYQGPQDNIDIDKLDFSEALNLNYLASLISGLKEKNSALANIAIFPQGDHLVISLPENLLFSTGKAEVSQEGKKALFLVGRPLRNMRNRIEIIGHTDPRPVENASGDEAAIQSNWELSLRRAISVASILAAVGYDKTAITRGLSSARYHELPEEWSAAQKLDLSRRVDILIMKDDGSTRRHMNFD